MCKQGQHGGFQSPLRSYRSVQAVHIARGRHEGERRCGRLGQGKLRAAESEHHPGMLACRCTPGPRIAMRVERLIEHLVIVLINNAVVADALTFSLERPVVRLL